MYVFDNKKDCGTWKLKKLSNSDLQVVELNTLALNISKTALLSLGTCRYSMY